LLQTNPMESYDIIMSLKNLQDKLITDYNLNNNCDSNDKNNDTNKNNGNDDDNDSDNDDDSLNARIKSYINIKYNVLSICMDTILSMISKANDGNKKYRYLLSSTIVQNSILKLTLASEYPFITINLMKQWSRFKALSYISIRISQSAAYLSFKLKWWIELISNSDNNNITKTLEVICSGHPCPHPNPEIKVTPTWTRVCVNDNNNNNNHEDDNNEDDDDYNDDVTNNDTDNKNERDINDKQINLTDIIINVDNDDNNNSNEVEYPTWTEVGDEIDDDDSDYDDLDIARLRSIEAVNVYKSIYRYFIDNEYHEGITTLEIYKPWNLIGVIKTNNNSQFAV